MAGAAGADGGGDEVGADPEVMKVLAPLTT